MRTPLSSSDVHERPDGSWLVPGRLIAIGEWERGLLFRHGRLAEVLDAGAHRRWRRGCTLRRVDLRPWVLQVPTQEVPTADRATVKVTVAGRVRVTDPVAFATAVQHPVDDLYLTVQLALRAVAAGTTVEELLDGRRAVGELLRSALGDVGHLGVAVETLDVKDIVLPRELKAAQAEVLVARAAATAALERARGETAAVRSLANAARIAADNPALLQLRLIQQLEGSSGHTVVLGSPPLGAG
jgi:regulator of protease activity HflC (stomatin/prohibitin superfamily)